MPREVRSITGVVSDVYPKLCAFDVKVDNRSRLGPPKATVHMALMENHRSLPKKDTAVTIKSQYFTLEYDFVIAMILTPEDVLLVDEMDLVAATSDEFIEIVKDLKLTATDMLEVAFHFESLRHYFKCPDAFTSEDLLMSLLKTFQGCKFQVQFLRNMRFLNNALRSCEGSYKDFGYWTFGSHWNTNDEYLIGCLYLKDDMTGMFYFTDGNRGLPVIFINQEESQILEFLNQYIIFKEYTIFTEIYNCEKKFSTLEYLMFDLSKVTKLGLSLSDKPVFKSLDDESFKKTSCTVLSKSLPTAISLNEVTHWLEVVMEDNKYCFLRFPTSFKDVYPFIKSDHTYHILYKLPPKKIWDREILTVSKRGNSQKTVFILETAPDTHLVPNSSTSSDICDVSEAHKKLTSQYGLVSFQGVISLKLFNNPISSRTRPATDSPSFGTPGEKTPKVRFETEGTFFEVYINNWENFPLPYGLVPNMRVIVRNVIPQKGKYYKSTALTSFEVLNYEPKIKFETANLWDVRYSVPFYLGMGHLIPSFTIIYGRLLFFSIVRVNMSRTEAEINITGYDNFGRSKIVAKGDAALKLMRLLLRFHKPAFETWYEGFCDSDEFTYRKDEPTVERPGLAGVAYTILYEYVKTLESSCFPLDLVCRKMDNDRDGIPVFFFIDGWEIREMKCRT